LLDTLVVFAVIIAAIVFTAHDDVLSVTAVSIAFVGMPLYFALDGFGGTPGKRLLGLKIVNGSGAHLGLRRGLTRYLGTLGATTRKSFRHRRVMWNRQRQFWHDISAGSYVVHRR